MLPVKTLTLIGAALMCPRKWNGTICESVKFVFSSVSSSIRIFTLTTCWKLFHQTLSLNRRMQGQERVNAHTCSFEVYIHLVVKEFPFFIFKSKSSLSYPFKSHYVNKYYFTNIQNKKQSFI